MTIKDLENCFIEAKKNNKDICVEVTIPNQEETEFIINKNRSLDNKLEYYKKTYNENLIHKNCEAIKIICCWIIDDSSFIKKDFIVSLLKESKTI